MNIINNYSDLKFAIRCLDVWKKLKPTSEELENALKYHIERNKNREPSENREGFDLPDDKVSKLNSISFQDYLEMLIDIIQEETGTWFFYVDIAGVIFDQVHHKKIFVYQTDSGYCVLFEK